MLWMLYMTSVSRNWRKPEKLHFYKQHTLAFLRFMQCLTHQITTKKTMVTHCQCQYRWIRSKTIYRRFLISLSAKIYVNTISNLNVWVCMTIIFVRIPLPRPYRGGLLAKRTVALCVQHLPPFLRKLSGHYRVQNSMSLVPMLGQTNAIPAL